MVVLWKSKERKEAQLFWSEAPAKTFRWVLLIQDGGIGFSHEFSDLENEEDVWHPAPKHYMMYLRRKFSFKREHSFYNEPHDELSLGFLHFEWSGKWCEKCFSGQKK